MPTATGCSRSRSTGDAAEKAADVPARQAPHRPTAACCGPIGRARPSCPAYLEDYAFLAHGLLRLHAATGDARWLGEARALTDRMIADFEDREEGGFFFTADGHESLLARPKDPFDNALPSGNSMAILDLLELYRLGHKTAYLDRAGKALSVFGTAIARVPVALPVMLVGLGQYLDERPDSASKEPAENATTKEAADQVVTATIRGDVGPSAAIAPGGEFAVTVKLAIKPGWHIYANPTGVAELSPTKLEVHPGSRNAVTMPKTDYPAGVQKVLASTGKEKVALYENEVEIKAHCLLAEDAKPGPVMVKYRLTYQACNDELCRAPVALEIPFNLTIGKK